eukprot:UN16200
MQNPTEVITLIPDRDTNQSQKTGGYLNMIINYLRYIVFNRLLLCQLIPYQEYT